MVAGILLALFALPGAAAVTISGYIDFGYIAAEGGASVLGATPNQVQAAAATNGNRSANNGFALNDVNIDLNATFTDRISGYASFNFVTGARALIDAAYIQFDQPGPLTGKGTAGRFFSAFGIEGRVAESNLTKFINMSLLSPFTVGSLDGAMYATTFGPVDVAVSYTNGDPIASSRMAGWGNGSITDPTYLQPGLYGAVGNAAPVNNDRAIAGRLGFKPIDGLEVGVSGSHDGSYTASGASVPINLKRNMLGFDLSYVHGGLSLKSEYLSVTEDGDASTGLRTGKAKAHGYYLEGLYCFNEKYAVGARYNRLKVKQSPTVAQTNNDVSTLSIAGCYNVSNNVMLKAEYDFNREYQLNGVTSGVGVTVPNDVLAFSLVGSF